MVGSRVSVVMVAEKEYSYEKVVSIPGAASGGPITLLLEDK